VNGAVVIALAAPHCAGRNRGWDRRGAVEDEIL